MIEKFFGAESRHRQSEKRMKEGEGEGTANNRMKSSEPAASIRPQAEFTTRKRDISTAKTVNMR
jgi:hypothetical protein